MHLIPTIIEKDHQYHYAYDIWLFRLWASVKLPGGNKFFFWPKPEKNKNTVDIESGTSYTYSVIQIKTCYLI